MSGFNEKRSQELCKILTNLYPSARKAVVYAEIATYHRNTQGWGNIRDALEHISHLCKTQDVDYDKEIGSVDEHLRRAWIESHEMVTEDKLYKFNERIKIPRFLYKITFSKRLPQIVIDEQDKKIRTYLVNARLSKGEQNVKEGVDYLIEAEKILDDLLKNIYPIEEVKFRALMLFLAIFAIVIAFLFGIYNLRI